MKFIHSADWHLGLRLGPHDLTELQFAQVERILQLCEQHQVDALIVAGDVFEKRTGLAALTKRLTELLKPHIERGLNVVLMAGNHDTPEHLQMMRALLGLEGAAISRLHVVEQPENFEMCGVQWGAMPYPSRDVLARYAREYQAAHGDDRDASMSAGYAAQVAQIASNFDNSKPAVFIGHVTVAGVKTPSEMELSYVPGLRIGTADLPRNVGYIALGHIHQPQKIEGEGVVPCYYCGDLDRYNRGERHDPQRGVYLVEVEANRETKVEWISLPATPFLDINIGANDIEELPARFPDYQNAFVYVTLDCAGADDAVGARRRVYELCPRVLDCVSINENSEVAERESFAPRDWKRTAIDYIGERFIERTDLTILQNKTLSILEEVENDVISR